MEVVKCTCCGGNQMRKRLDGSVVCEFCGSIFKPDADEKTVSGALTDAKIISLFLDAEKYRISKKYGDEIQTLIKALELDETKAITLVKLGRAYRVCGFLDKAMDCYKDAIKYDPTYGQAYGNIGGVYIIKKDYQTAVGYYEKATNLIDPGTSDYAMTLGNYALAVGMLGDKKRAAQLLADAEKHGYKNGAAVRKAAGLGLFSKFFG